MHESELPAVSVVNPVTAAGADQHVQQEISLRARALGRTLRRSWLPAAAAAGLITGWLVTRGRRTRERGLR
jgi:hypothetical protein